MFILFILELVAVILGFALGSDIIDDIIDKASAQE